VCHLVSTPLLQFPQVNYVNKDGEQADIERHLILERSMSETGTNWFHRLFQTNANLVHLCVTMLIRKRKPAFIVPSWNIQLKPNCVHMERTMDVRQNRQHFIDKSKETTTSDGRAESSQHSQSSPSHISTK